MFLNAATQSSKHRAAAHAPGPPRCSHYSRSARAAAMQPSTTQVLTAAALSCMLLLYLQRRRLPTRRAAIEIRDEATVMLVADVDYQQKRVLREVHLREVKHSASRRLEDVVRALVAEARDVGAEQATVFERPKVSVGTSVLRAVEDRWRRSRCDGAFDLRVVSFLAQAPPWLPS